MNEDLKDINLREEFQKKLKELMLDEILMEDLSRIYLPMANLIKTALNVDEQAHIIGINGAQGAGKTTFSKLLKLVLEQKFGMRVVQLSIDDFYYSTPPPVKSRDFLYIYAVFLASAAKSIKFF